MAKIIVGKILSAHGIRGEVKVKPLSDNPRRFRRGRQLFIEGEGEAFLVTSVREAKEDLLIVKFKGFDDRNRAEKLRGSLLKVEEEQADPLPEDVFYHFQLIGMAVYEESGEYLGQLAEIIDSGANDVYRVEGDNGDFLLLPALKQVVAQVDVAEKKMTVRLLPGLREACTYHGR